MSRVPTFAAARALPLPDQPLAYELVLPVLGIPVRFEADAALLRDGIERTFGAWRTAARLAEAFSSPLPPVQPRVVLRLADDDEPATPAQLAAEVEEGRRLLLAGAGLDGWAELDRIAAVARVAPRFAADADRLRDALATLTLFLVTRLDREPVHAAAVGLGTAGLVFAGPSGTGKSTLAYAAHRAGLRVLSDDAVYVQLRPRCRVWGMAGPIHLSPTAIAHFPELAGAPVTLRPNGKRKIAVPAAQPGIFALGPEPPVFERTGLCLLERGADDVALEAIPVDAAVEQVASNLDPGFDLFRDSIAHRIRALAAGGAWRLRLSPDPNAAIPRIREMLAALAGAPTAEPPGDD
jgi:hypothetical protein